MTTIAEKTNSVKLGAKRFVRRLFLIIFIIFIGLMVFFHYATYSTGVRAGIVLKVSEKGALFKTHEGQLDLMSFGAVKSDNSLSQTFDFSVMKDHDDVFQILEEVSLTGERVRLRYEEKYVKLFWRGDTKYFVTEIERTPNKEVPEKRTPFGS